MLFGGSCAGEGEQTDHEGKSEATERLPSGHCFAPDILATPDILTELLLTYQTRLILSGAMGVPVLQTNALRKPSRFASTPLTRYLPGACELVLASSLADSCVWFSHQA